MKREGIRVASNEIFGLEKKQAPEIRKRGVGWKIAYQNDRVQKYQLIKICMKKENRDV